MEEVNILIISIIAGTATYTISHILNKGAVIASASITLISGLILPYFFPLTGSVLATAAACSSYAAMVSVENASNIFEMAVISLITGTLFIAASSAYTGIGGRLGTIGAISCFVWLGFKKIFTRSDQLSGNKSLSYKD